jgi:hypothetical protein
MIQTRIEREMEELNLERSEEEEDTFIVQRSSVELEESMQANEGNERTLRRKRSSSEDAMHSINKVIKKRKLSSSTIEFKTEKDVKKFYLNINKNVKVKPTLLETIFEKDESLEEETFTKDLGRATKRTLNVCDGFNINKSLIKKRKNLIKKNWGSRKKPRKVALKTFKEEFQKKMELFSMSSD